MTTESGNVQPCDAMVWRNSSLGLRERDIEAALAAPGAFQQELNRDCGLAGSRLALEEEHVTTRESALQYIIQTADAGQGLHVGTRVGHCDHLG